MVTLGNEGDSIVVKNTKVRNGRELIEISPLMFADVAKKSAVFFSCIMESTHCSYLSIHATPKESKNLFYSFL